MNTISQNYEIERNMKDEKGNLKQEYVNNFEASFAKSILDLVKEGNEITIYKFQSSIQNIEVETDIKIGNKLLKEKNIKECYNCTSLIDIMKLKVYNGDKERLLNVRGRGIEINNENGKLKPKLKIGDNNE